MGSYSTLEGDLEFNSFRAYNKAKKLLEPYFAETPEAFAFKIDYPMELSTSGEFKEYFGSLKLRGYSMYNLHVIEDDICALDALGYIIGHMNDGDYFGWGTLVIPGVSEAELYRVYCAFDTSAVLGSYVFLCEEDYNSYLQGDFKGVLPTELPTAEHADAMDFHMYLDEYRTSDITYAVIDDFAFEISKLYKTLLKVGGTPEVLELLDAFKHRWRYGDEEVSW